MKKIILVSIAILFLFSASSFAQVGLSIKGQGTYGFFLKPELPEATSPEEKWTKGGFGFSGQVLYRVAGKILSLGVEAGYLRFWKWEFTGEMWGLVDGSLELVDVKAEISRSAVPILGVIQIEAPLPLVSPYLQIGPGIYPLTITTKVTVLGKEEKDKDRETKFGIMAAVGVTIPLAPKLNLDVGGKLHMIFTENESTIMLNPVAGILVRF